MLTPSFQPFPLIHTQRLTLRQLVPADAVSLFDMRSRPDIAEALGKPPAESLGEMEALVGLIENDLVQGNGITWAISFHEDPLLLGTIAFWRIDKKHYRAEVGYLLHPDYHGRGIMQEALDPIMEYGFNGMGLHSVEARTSLDNLKSISLLRKNGFVQEGHLRESHFDGNTFSDTLVWGRLGIDRALE